MGMFISGNVHYKQYKLIDTIHIVTKNTPSVCVCVCVLSITIHVPDHVSQPLSQAVTVTSQQPGSFHSMN